MFPWPQTLHVAGRVIKFLFRDSQGPSPELLYHWYALDPQKVSRFLVKYPRAMPAEQFLSMLKGKPHLSGYAEDIEQQLTQVAREHPGDCIYAQLH